MHELSIRRMLNRCLPRKLSILMYIDVSIEEHQKRELGLAQQKQDPDQCSGAGVCVTKHRGGLLKNC